VNDGEQHYLSANDEFDAIYTVSKSIYELDDVNQYKYEFEPDIIQLNLDEEITYYDEDSNSEIVGLAKYFAINVSGVICSTIY
jgi:hypothetical protein